MFYKIGALENFAKLAGKQPASTCNVIKKRDLNRCFPVNFANFVISTFLKKTTADCDLARLL